MTELQTTISRLKKTISAGNALLAELEAGQKDLDKLKAPKFPSTFIAMPTGRSSLFTIGLEIPYEEARLPKNFKGRSVFVKSDIRQIITGLQTLLGESDA